jgi:hypothetical protein
MSHFETGIQNKNRIKNEQYNYFISYLIVFSGTIRLLKGDIVQRLKAGGETTHRGAEGANRLR